MPSPILPSENWWDQARRYRTQAERYAEELDAVGTGRLRTWQLDFSEEAAIAMFRYETYGEGDLSQPIFSEGRVNGYAFGKHLLNLQLDLYRQGIREGLTTKAELYGDRALDQAWLHEVLPKIPAGSHALLRNHA